MIGGVPGGRSTHGICLGVLSWLVAEGHAGDVALGGLGAVIEYRYDDDEAGSPWQFLLHVDARGDDAQRAALADILLGRLGGDLVLALPWVRKLSHLIEVRTSAIEIEHGTPGGRVRIGSDLLLKASRPVETEKSVACIVPGYERPGTELYADELTVHDDPFDWALAGNCAFASSFEYTSDHPA
jgi:hypothetical protein